MKGTDVSSAAPNPPVPVAIIGIGCLFPKADDLARYWANIRNGIDALSDVPETHWRPEDYYDADPRAPDRTYARRGGFLSPVEFPALEFGIAPANLDATDTTQLLGLLVAREALADAGYDPRGGRAFDRERVSVILGVTGTLELVIPLGARLGHPIWRRALREAGVPADTAEDVVKRIADSYVGWQENSFPGLLGNVVAGRIANRLDLGGTNCVVDAACASSIGALNLALLELAAGRCDMALTGGFDTFNDIFMYMCFSKTPALSPTGDARPFDASGDGTILGEGLGALVLKRLDDARRDGDKVYAVIRSVGASSDGKVGAVYAPSAAGQAKALRQAYALAGVSPGTIELVEAHGTGTTVGDATEVAALNEVYREARAEGTWCALGSVKSQIGHTKAAAGAAGLIKAALALHHKVVPPTAKVSRPIEAAAPGASPFYVNTEARPWLPRPDHPRRAAVSAFGFGGSNFHCVLEEADPAKPGIDWDGDVQIVTFSAAGPEPLRAALDAWDPGPSWETLRSSAARAREAFRAEAPYRLALVLERKADRARVLDKARALLSSSPRRSSSSPADGVYLGVGDIPGPLAFLFPGQGSQSVGMLRGLSCAFPALQDALAGADRAGPADDRVSDRIYPHPAFTDEERSRQEETLRATQVAQPAIGAVSLGVLGILEHFGVKADAVAGHSFGELTALRAAGRIGDEAFHRLARLRGELMAGRGGENGAMLAVFAPLEQVESALRDGGFDLVLANRNAPQQAVVSGAAEEVARAARWFAGRKVATRPLPVSAAFHSRFVADATVPLGAALREVAFATARIPVYSNATASPYPDDMDEARALLAGQLARPVEFVAQVEAMYQAGVRTFLEVGPEAKLTGLVGAILGDRPHVALAVDSSGGRRGNFADLARALAQLAALGYPVRLNLWDEGGDFQNVPASKPGLTVKVCGANPSPRPKPVSNGDLTHAPRRNGRLPQPAMSSPQNGMPPTVNHRAPSHDPGVLAQALRTSQESLIALQKLSEQTALLHRKFLEGQEKTQHSFRTLLEQQQRLLTTAPATLTPSLQAPAPLTPRPLPAEPVAAPAPPPEVDRTATVLMEVVSEKTGYPVEMLEPGMQLDADLGIDSIKRVEILSALQERLPDAPVVKPEHLGSLRTLKQIAEFLGQAEPADPPPAPPSAPDQTLSVLLEVVSAKTGYPVEMLEPGMQLDADLGIDSIKRVEILSALQDRLPDAPVVKPEHLGSLRTLGQIADFLGRSEPSPDTLSPSPDRTLTHLLEVVSEKTGYPVEMLEPGMQLDADLGIDSIKRVEILSALQERLPDAPVVKPEHLGSLRTLGQIAEFLAGGESRGSLFPAVTASSPSPAPVKGASPVEEEAAHHSHPSIQRLILRSVALNGSYVDDPIALRPGGEIWVTAKRSGLAEALAARLNALGYKVRVVALDADVARDLPSTLDGLVLLASGAEDGVVKGAFRLLRTVAPALRRAGKEGAAVLATVTRLDGAFGFQGLDPHAEPTAGALAGLAKTAAHEWPEVHCKAIDLDPALAELDEAAEAIVAELFRRGPSEIGLGREGRRALELCPSALNGDGRIPPLSPGDVVVITGGARGITAEVAVALAEAFRPTLVLLGRSPEPGAEPDWLAPLDGDAEIKHALAARANGRATPQTVGEQFRAVLVNREIRRNLGRIEAAGGRVLYRAVDVRDGEAVAACLASVRAEFGPVRGLIHGAGVLADRRIEDKNDEQFAAVYDTKVAGLRALLRATERDDLKVLVLFSSSTARFGRAGQVAYAAANEVLNKVAQREALRRPSCRVVAVNWGPWDGGMVTDALKPLFASEGVALIPPRAGARYLVEEIQTATDRPVEVVVLGGTSLPTGLTPPGPKPPAAAPSAALSVVFERLIDLASLPILRSHVIDGRPVLPMALILEWLAQGAMHRNPGLVFAGVDRLRLLKGVVLRDDRPETVRVLAGKPARDGGHYVVPVELRGVTRDGDEVPHARGAVVLADRHPQGKPGLGALDLPPFAMSPGELYARVLFHGPELHGIERVDGCGTAGIAARVATAPAPASWVEKPLRQTWLSDPLALDGAFQLMIVWSAERFGAGSLPTSVGRYRQFRRAFPGGGVRVIARITQATEHRALADVEFLDADGAPVARIDDYECVIDASLNQAFRRNHTALTSR